MLRKEEDIDLDNIEFHDEKQHSVSVEEDETWKLEEEIGIMSVLNVRVLWIDLDKKINMKACWGTIED